jgi:hypothetical protein
LGLCVAVLALFEIGGAAADGALLMVSRSSSIHHEGAVNDSGGIDPANPPYSTTLNTNSTVAAFTQSLGVAPNVLSLSSTHTYGMDTNASQSSWISYNGDLSLNTIAGVGDTSSLATGFPPPPGGGSGKANSFFDVFFDVAGDTTPVYLDASVTGSGPAGPNPMGKATFDLIQLGLPNVTLVHRESITGVASTYFNPALALPVGSYRMTVNADSATSTADSMMMFTSSWNVTLVPEPSAPVLLAAGGIVALSWQFSRRSRGQRRRRLE